VQNRAILVEMLDFQNIFQKEVKFNFSVVSEHKIKM